MRELSMAALLAALAVLPACTTYQTQATAPTVSYNYADEEDYASVAEQADDFCRDNYSRNARLVDRDPNAGGYEATFACE